MLGFDNKEEGTSEQCTFIDVKFNPLAVQIVSKKTRNGSISRNARS